MIFKRSLIALAVASLLGAGTAYAQDGEGSTSTLAANIRANTDVNGCADGEPVQGINGTSTYLARSSESFIVVVQVFLEENDLFGLNNLGVDEFNAEGAILSANFSGDPDTVCTLDFRELRPSPSAGLHAVYAVKGRQRGDDLRFTDGECFSLSTDQIPALSAGDTVSVDVSSSCTTNAAAVGTYQ